MGVRQRWRHFKLRISHIANMKAFKTLRKLLFEQSHLSAYLPIMKEQLPTKMARIYGDRSYSEEAGIKDNHPEHRQARKGQLISDFFLRSKQSLDPIMTSLLFWYGLVCFCIVAVYVMTGMAVVFGQEAWIDLSTDPFTIIISVICILIFFGDIFVQLSTGFLTRGMIVVDRERSVRRYLRSLLVVDVLLVLIMVIAMASGQNFTNVLLLPVVVIKFARMFDLDRLFIRNLSTTPNKKAVYVIGKQLLTVFLIGHTFGIMFYAIDYALTLMPICLENQSLCWLYSATAYSPIMECGWRLRYFWSLYWGLNTITMISYGDIAPNNPTETIFALICFCCSLLIYGYVVNSIIQIMLEARNSRDNFREELILHTTYMEIIAVSKPNQYDFRDYLESKYFEQRDRKQELEEEMKSRLPVELREELLKSAFHKLYGGLQEMLFSSPSIVKLLYFLQQRHFTHGETILEQGAPLTQLIYLQKGQLQLSCARYQKTHPIITICTPDQFIGLYEFFLNERAAFTVKTVVPSAMYFLSREEMLQQVGRFTDLRQNWKLVRDELKFDCNYQRIFYCCYFCGSNHHWYRCMNIFPNFSNLALRTEGMPVDRSRIAACRTHVWKEAKDVREMGRAGKVQDAVLRKIQERVSSLRSIKEAWRREFEVDGHHEWQYYKPGQNLSKLKEQWNPKKQSNIPQQPTAHLPFAFLPPSLF